MIESRLTNSICYILLALLLFPAIQPLLAGDFTCGYDNTFHLWRAVETEHLLRQSVIFSRWAPDMAHGYGYPLSNFAAPASAYAVALLRLTGLPWVWALNLTFILGWALSVYAMYLLASDLFDRYAGLAAAVLYGYVPFHAYDVFYRGGLSQSVAWFLPPLILWALRRADRRVGFVVTALGAAGLILTHNAFALLFAPILIAYLPLAGYERNKKMVVWGGLALLAGLGLSAFFWLPALVELGFVHSERLGGGWVFDYANNFLPLSQLFALPRNADPSLINDWPARGLGLVPALLALAGLLALRDRARRPTVSFFAFILAGCLFLILPISQPVWDAIPLLQRVQFPWRLVGPAALCAAILTGAAVSHLSLAVSRLLPARPHLPGLVPMAAVLLVVLPHLGWFYPDHCSPPADTSIAGMIAWERATDTLGTTAKGEYLPVWVHQMPQDPALDAAYAQASSLSLVGGGLGRGASVARLSPESLPEGARVIRAEYGPVDAAIELESRVPFQARYLAFYYPGWRVTVDGALVPITPTDPDGLISFDVPAGHHTIRVHFGETPLRLAADAISLVSLAALIAITALRPKSQLPNYPITRSFTIQVSLLVVVLLLFFKLILIDRVDTPLRRANLVDGRLQSVDVPAEITFGDEFVLLGYDLLPESVPSGEWFEIQTYWRALQPGGPDYGVTINVVDAEGCRWNGAEIRPPRWHRTPPPVWEWPPDQYAIVALSIPLLPGTPPGDYTIEAVAFDRDTLAPLTAYDAGGRALGPSLPLGQIAVAAPRRPADPDELGIRNRLDAPLGPLRLLGADFDRDEAAPGAPVLLTTFWRADEQPAGDPIFHLALLAPDGSTVAEYKEIRFFEKNLVSSGDVWRGQRLLHLPAALETAVYTWTISLSPHLPVPLSPISITAPNRTFTPPPVDLEINTRLGDIATLVGADLPISQSPNSPITVTLVWRAEAETHTSYNVFLHLTGPDGALVAQSDGIPADWTRPTTGWLPGEYITDARVLHIPPDAPPGEYALLAGLYLPGGERLVTPNGDDSIPLAIIPVQPP